MGGARLRPPFADYAKRHLMENPYEPPSATLPTNGIRDWDRNACPYCLHHQSLWAAINAIRKYRCRQCGRSLIVTLPRKMSHAITVCISLVVMAYLICVFVYRLQPTTLVVCLNLLVIPLNFLTRYSFGYFHPASREWIASRTELIHPQPREAET